MAFKRICMIFALVAGAAGLTACAEDGPIESHTVQTANGEVELTVVDSAAQAMTVERGPIVSEPMNLCEAVCASHCGGRDKVAYCGRGFGGGCYVRCTESDDGPGLPGGEPEVQTPEGD